MRGLTRLLSRISTGTPSLAALILLVCLSFLLLLVIVNTFQQTAIHNQPTATPIQVNSQLSLGDRSGDKSLCSEGHTNLFHRQGEKAIALKAEPMTESGTVFAGQVIIYTFKAQAGQVFNFQTSDPLCLYLQAPDRQMVRQHALPQTGQYALYISIPSGSATFKLTMSLNQAKTAQTKATSTETPQLEDNLASITSVASLAPSVHKLVPQELQGDAYLRHLFYTEPNQNRLIVIASYAQREYQRLEFLNLEAGIALMKMIYAARDDGVWILPASAFRNFEQQKKIFNAHVQRLGSIEGAAMVSAPPGYSEHHTGYAVDLTDGHLVNQDLSMKFANTEAYRWLQQNAAKFGFELSFPLDNPQGISYEPWHWRFVGSPAAMQIFAKARNLKK